MAENKAGSPSTVADATAEMEDQWFPLQPIEIKMLTYTFGLGIVLLVIFLVVFGVHL
jgi:hypothetical protein